METRPPRGSRKHVLDWTGEPSFLDEFQAILKPAPVSFATLSNFMPRGHTEPDEALLERFGPKLWPAHPAWQSLDEWWLLHKARANTPNWDIAASCEIEGNPGLVLVEAKANWYELSPRGKPLSASASRNSLENHERIGRAIDEACSAWRSVDSRCAFSRDSHYQLANRLAFTWKLAALGIPVVLLYLGFTSDSGISDAGPPFADDRDWHRAFDEHTAGILPSVLFDRRIEFDGVPVWLLSRSRPVLSPSPPRSPSQAHHPGDLGIPEES